MGTALGLYALANIFFFGSGVEWRKYYRSSSNTAKNIRVQFQGS